MTLIRLLQIVQIDSLLVLERDLKISRVRQAEIFHYNIYKISRALHFSHRMTEPVRSTIFNFIHLYFYNVWLLKAATDEHSLGTRKHSLQQCIFEKLDLST